MKKLGGLLISILYIIAVVNCKLEVPIDEPEKIILEIEETRIMNDFIVKPITEYPAYYVQGNRVLGIPVDCKGPTDLMRFLPEIEVDGEVFIHRFDKFFVVDGKIYFTVSENFVIDEETGESEIITKYCSQTAGKITYLTEAKFPEMPKPERVEGETGDYVISTDEYNGDPISVASRTKLEDSKIVPDYSESMGFIDGFIEIEGGLLIHAQVGRGASRPEGLLFWPDGLRTMNHWKESGRFWK